MLSEAGIRSAIRAAPNSGKARAVLSDAGPRGEGRLTLIIRTSDERVTAEWYALWYVAERRKMAKIGGYPTTGLAAARKLYREDYATKISLGQEVAGPRVRRERLGVTVLDLFQAYVDHLKAAGKKSWREADRVLITGGDAAVTKLGSGVRAADVTPSDIIPYLSAMHARGAVVGAAAARAWLSAAFNHALRSENAYAGTASGVKWGLKVNPVSVIPGDRSAFRTGDRHLSQAELRDFWNWLAGLEDYSRVGALLRLCMATGQRIIEIAALRDTMYDPVAKMIDWGKTKNGRPHNIPLPRQAVDILDSLTPNKHGLYFPHSVNPREPLISDRAGDLVRRYLDQAEGVRKFVPRDIRRTWKTLAGPAGISKEIRDRLQNHAKSDVSSRHYDRWEALPERRAAMEAWSDYLDRILSGDLDTEVVKLEGVGRK